MLSKCINVKNRSISHNFYMLIQNDKSYIDLLKINDILGIHYAYMYFTTIWCNCMIECKRVIEELSVKICINDKIIESIYNAWIYHLLCTHHLCTTKEVWMCQNMIDSLPSFFTKGFTIYQKESWWFYHLSMVNMSVFNHFVTI